MRPALLNPFLSSLFVCFCSSDIGGVLLACLGVGVSGVVEERPEIT
jgi:hypothetical protein